MSGSIAAIITMGYGSWGSVGLVLTLGYGTADAAAVTSIPVDMPRRLPLVELTKRP